MSASVNAGREMESSWLIQRLTRPRQASGPFKDNPFSFGGGLLNGGLSKSAMGLLRGIFGFDYMGSAEFEFGAVPEALNRIANSELVQFSLTVPLSEVPANWRDKSKTKPEGSATIYVLCPDDFGDEVSERVEMWARAEPRLKEGTRLASSLRPVEEWDRDVCGWLELDNGFFFFTDEEMWQKTCALFGLASATTTVAVASEEVDSQ